MRTIKALAAIAALIFMSACSSNNEAAAPASTTVTPGSIADFKQNVGDRVYFDTDQSVVREDNAQTRGLIKSVHHLVEVEEVGK